MDGEELAEIDDQGRDEVDLRAEAVSRNHLRTHFPKNKYCRAYLGMQVLGHAYAGGLA